MLETVLSAKHVVNHSILTTNLKVNIITPHNIYKENWAPRDCV